MLAMNGNLDKERTLCRHEQPTLYADNIKRAKTVRGGCVKAGVGLETVAVRGMWGMGV